MRLKIAFLLAVALMLAAPAFAQTPVKKPVKDGSTGSINGHGYVDLGLSVKWATCNVGASSPSDYGDYYAWGETKPKSEYTEENYLLRGKSVGKIAGDVRYDAASANWGGTWRLPTSKEVEELINKCKAVWTTRNGHNGLEVTGPNGNSIFLPAAGDKSGTSFFAAPGSRGDYNSGSGGGENAFIYFILSDGFARCMTGRHSGSSVRPVSE
ncbi:MAG: hypothetical protein LUI09_04120 [Prevotellaceae bacterium]|nr:hypothetical protein [Prevotellaceae bacterium]